MFKKYETTVNCGLTTLLFVTVISSLPAYSQISSRGYNPIKQGFQMKLLMGDQGIIGDAADAWTGIEYGLGCEYPENSSIEHLNVGGLWIGALADTGRHGRPQVAKLVTTTDEQDSGYSFNFNNTVTTDSANPWRRASTLSQDSSAVSESDYYCSYTDTNTGQGFLKHKPLGIKVLQRSFAWANAVRVPLIIIEYYVVRIRNDSLKNVYIALHFVPLVGYLGTYSNVSGYWPELRTGYTQNPSLKESTPIGFTILSTPKPLTDLTYYSFRWFGVHDASRKTYDDTERYNWMSGLAFPGQPNIRTNQPVTDPGGAGIFFSFGRFDTWNVSETLKVTLALVSGSSLQFGPDNLYDNARFAQTLYSRHYHPPIVLPAPKLSFEYGDNKVTLRWSPSATEHNPEDFWDNENNLANIYPPDHWRRRNPPSGISTGGRVFEGYRLYRSEDPTGTTGSFTLLRQWDVIDSVGPRYEYDVGIETTFVDSNLNTNKTYWYAVTSFGIPDLHTIDYVDWDGAVKVETLFTKSAETSVLASRKRVNIPFSVSTNVGEVKVVPNPYRVDEDYTFESGGWEGRARSWTEDKRMIKFIHLPPTCTIRIFTIAGDVIATLHHDNPTRGELSWNLISESGRAIASGVYIFTVESDFGKQMGKYVIIR